MVQSFRDAQGPRFDSLSQGKFFSKGCFSKLNGNGMNTLYWSKYWGKADCISGDLILRLIGVDLNRQIGVELVDPKTNWFPRAELTIKYLKSILINNT